MRTWMMACVCALIAASAVAADLAVPITVEEPAGIARKAEAVSGGIPLPAAAFTKDQTFALVDAAGNAVPLQTIPLSVDEKGFIRWLLLDFQTDLGAREKKMFTLKTGAPASPATALKVTDGAAGVTVDTGKVKFTIAKDKPFSLFTTVEAGGRTVLSGGEASYTENTNAEAAPHRYMADKPASVAVEYAGPLRTTVCVKGRFVGDDQTKLLYIARVTAWAGRSNVHVKYSLANSNEEHYTWRRIQDSSVEMKLAGDARGAALGGSKALEADGPCWMQQSMRVVKAAVHGEDELGNASWLHATPGAARPGGCKAMSGDNELWTSSGKGDVSQGWAAAKLAAGGTLFVTDLYFVEDPPRKLAVNRNSVVLSGIVEPLAGTTNPFCDKTRWLMDSSHLSSQYVLDFAAPADAAALSEAARTARTRLIAVAPPAWYFSTEALPTGKFGTQADELAAYDKWGWKYNPGQVPKGPGAVLASMPRWSGGDDNHYTSEQDTLDGLVLMFCRTGDRSFFDAGESWANYFMDLEAWRTDGWRYKDGGVWWPSGGPLGNRPQRPKDPLTGAYNGVPGSRQSKEPFTKEAARDLLFLAISKQCYCHNWGEGLAEWHMITGDRDAYDAAIDCVEQNYDTQKRAFGKTPGKPAGFSRDFTRSCYLTNAARLMAPTDPFVIEASDYLARVYLEMPNREPRGFLNGPSKIDMKTLEQKVGPNGLAKMKELGVTLDEKTGEFTDPKTGAKWKANVDPHTWMFPPLSRAMETYYHITGNEDAADWLIAFGQAAAHVLYQEKHGNLAYGGFLVDFPTKGFAWDRHSWNIPEGVKDGEGEKINGYLAQFYPDVPARAYVYAGDMMCKQRAFDFWNYGSHRGYYTPKMHSVGGVGWWINVYTTHSECVSFTGKTIYIGAHPKADEKPPAAVKDLKVTLDGAAATVLFTAPADEAGKVARYQVKCSDKPIVSYEDFLKAYAANDDAKVTNWWMTKNLAGEPAPKTPGAREAFTVTGVPANATYFALCSFDDSSNRSAMSNVVEVGR